MIKIQHHKLDEYAKHHHNELSKKISKEFPSFSTYTVDEILKAAPSKLHEIATWFDTLSDTQKSQFDFMIEKYKNFTTKKQEYDAYDLAEKLNVNVCPYCNRNYTFTIKDKNNKSTRPDFDHFYPKDDYPVLALSFYNLIHSCILCNSRLKGTAKFSIKTHLHPYLDSFDKHAKFGFEIKDSSFYCSENGFDVKINTAESRAESTVKDFALQALYDNHKDTVLELIQKAEMYNDSYIDELFNRYEGTLFKNKEDLLRLIFGGYITDEEIGKRPLSKLTKDILEQLEII